MRIAQREVTCFASGIINLQSVDLFNFRLVIYFYAKKLQGGSRELTIFSKKSLYFGDKLYVQISIPHKFEM